MIETVSVIAGAVTAEPATKYAVVVPVQTVDVTVGSVKNMSDILREKAASVTASATGAGLN
jgi:hypothetical protein